MFDFNLNDFELPIYIEKDEEYIAVLFKKLDEYYIKSQVDLGLPEVEKNVKNNVECIKDAIKNYYAGKPGKSYEKIMGYINAYKGNDMICAKIDNNYAFRGSSPSNLRPSELVKKNKQKYDNQLNYPLSFYRARKSTEFLDREDMLHIPLDKRWMIGKQRFSLDGIPCLYLSTTSWCNWIEMEKPKLSEFQVSAFKIPTDLKILNLAFSQNVINGMNTAYNEQEKKRRMAMIEFFPLVIATSFKIRNEHARSYKSEYMISQLVMLACAELKIDGIAYLTKNTSDYYSYPQGVNLAIMIPSNDGYKYWNRIDEIQLTKPVCFSEYIMAETRGCSKKYNEYKSYTNAVFKDGYCGKISIAEQQMQYIDTRFSKFDEYLQRLQFESVRNVNIANNVF